MTAVHPADWATARRRAETLRTRHPHAADVLTLYLALLDVWEESAAAARDTRPDSLAAWSARHVLPRVVAATAYGPEPLAARAAGVGEPALRAWLAGDETLGPVERYVARAATRGPLTAVDAGAACAADPAPRGGRRCPDCGGPPQLSYRTDAGDRLVSGRRMLQCARCAASWACAAHTCAGCGETSRRTVYAEHREGTAVGRRDADGSEFGHLRVEACTGCSRYLVDVDLGRDPRAVPEADELTALPLGLYAGEQGFTKLTPNVMGL
ncbi:Protein FdhE [Streptomyces sp. RB5]|uniref:Protein FdhE n=1 Tax=Streptomyces smaragdinus TaxID=2585196 RepID=A0A7K0C9U2_9ACTN|nr:formate dehydrogenase accessory protein FdhE [Streptomyces smaragdinus]MQY10153.1 Protein FdhE [Streptomyces smaragdinus]